MNPATLLHDWGGTALTARENVARIDGRLQPIDLIGVYNAANDPDLGTDAGWTPTRYTKIDPAPSVAGRSPPTRAPAACSDGAHRTPASQVSPTAPFRARPAPPGGRRRAGRPAPAP